MKKPCCKKGFTLIELLIVIAIIGILAVALLPTILGAPSKGRDTARIADLQKYEKVLMSNNLTGIAYPSLSTTPAIPSNPTCADTLSLKFEDFGGKLPVDPLNGNKVKGVTDCDSKYVYKADPSGASIPAGPGGNPPASTVGSGTYSFGLYAHLENCVINNAVLCDDALGGKITPALCQGTTTTPADNLCYAVLVK